jgi:hypothetical protein
MAAALSENAGCWIMKKPEETRQRKREQEAEARGMSVTQ